MNTSSHVPVVPPPAPSLFVGHGTPMLALADEDRAVDALRLAVSKFAVPRAVVVLSAHGFAQADITEVDAAAKLHALHDFAGFPAELRRLDYRAPGDPDVAALVCQTLGGVATEHGAQLVAHGGLDHGTWMPARWMFPRANVPLIMVHAPQSSTPQDMLRMGRALAPLRRQGVMVMGSGSAVHNLQRLQWHAKNGPAAGYAQRFEDWVVQHLMTGGVEALAQYADQAPHAEEAHPSSDHFLPLLFVLGAALKEDRLQLIHRGVEYSSVSMLSFALSPPAAAEQLTVLG